jgi:hypothetical protein
MLLCLPCGALGAQQRATTATGPAGVTSGRTSRPPCDSSDVVRELTCSDSVRRQPARGTARPGVLEHSTRTNILVMTGAGGAALGLMWYLPENISKWDKSRPMHEYLRTAYTKPPVWDRDTWGWDYGIHPVLGSWGYLMERNYGERPLRSFAIATLGSVGWEYGFEALIERPSIQDLLVTSPVGSLVGEAAYRLTQHFRRNGLTFWEKAAIVVINPVTVVQQHGFGK